MTRMLTVSFVFCFLFACNNAPTTETADGILPSPSHLEWADAEIGAMFHLDMQVFEPSYQWRATRDYQPDVSVFNPTELNTDQWIESVRAAGATYAVLVAKHCSGFSLWPTEAHPYSVKNTPWRNGQGDIVRDFIESCKKYGVKPGIYASTTANAYMKVDNPGLVLSGDSAEQQRYNEVVKTQLTELWSRYGDLFEIWFDGGVLPVEDGGADVLSLMRQYQPNAVAFQGPYGYEHNIRWVGNEHGVAPYPCWSRADSTTSASGVVEIKGLNGNPEGGFWCPGEADFPIRLGTSEKPVFEGGWFWHEGQDDRILSLDGLMEKYVSTVGRNTNMLLGVVVDNRGLIPDADVKRLAEFGQEVDRHFGKPIATTSGSGKEFLLSFDTPQPLRYAVFGEDLTKGERIREYTLYGEQNGTWKKLADGTSVGHKRIEVIDDQGNFDKLRLEIRDAAGEPQLRWFECY